MLSHLDLMIHGIHVQALHELAACSAVRECMNGLEVKCIVGVFSLEP